MNADEDVKTGDASEVGELKGEPQRLMRVTVCACTYKRPDGLAELLDGLSKQVFSHVRPPQWDVIIADNEGSAEAEAVCRSFQQKSSIPLTYVHEPKRGISHARNACLDRIPPESDFFAMIDDDEIPEPDWLDHLLLAQRETGADVVLGRVLPIFDDSAPQWVKDGGFFGSPSRRPGSIDDIHTDQEEIGGGATNNVLVRCSAFRQLNLRFDPERGLTGGSDSLFFRLLKLAGHPIMFAANAKVWEVVPPERTTLKYLLRSEYRGGNLKIRNKLQAKKADAGKLETARMAAKLCGRGFAEIAAGCVDVVRSYFRPQRRLDDVAMGAMRVAGGCGILASLFGLRFEHYR